MLPHVSKKPQLTCRLTQCPDQNLTSMMKRESPAPLVQRFPGSIESVSRDSIYPSFRPGRAPPRRFGTTTANNSMHVCIGLFFLSLPDSFPCVFMHGHVCRACARASFCHMTMAAFHLATYLGSTMYTSTTQIYTSQTHIDCQASMESENLLANIHTYSLRYACPDIPVDEVG